MGDGLSTWFASLAPSGALTPTPRRGSSLPRLGVTNHSDALRKGQLPGCTATSCNTSEWRTFTPRSEPKKEDTTIRTTIAALGLIAAAGVAHAQMQAPSTPEGRDGRSMPGASSNPNTSQPTSPMNPSAAEAAAKAEVEKKGYTGVKSLTRDPAGNWAAKAMKNNVEIAVILEPSGNVREQQGQTLELMIRAARPRGTFTSLVPRGASPMGLSLGDMR